MSGPVCDFTGLEVGRATLSGYRTGISDAINRSMWLKVLSSPCSVKSNSATDSSSGSKKRAVRNYRRGICMPAARIMAVTKYHPLPKIRVLVNETIIS
jgi:hypothetical protein